MQSRFKLSSPASSSPQSSRLLVSPLATPYETNRNKRPPKRPLQDENQPPLGPFNTPPPPKRLKKSSSYTLPSPSPLTAWPSPTPLFPTQPAAFLFPTPSSSASSTLPSPLTGYPTPHFPTQPSPAASNAYRRRNLNSSEKLEIVLDTISSVGWTFTHFLHYLFQNPKEIHWSAQHLQVAGRFLRGENVYTVGHILELWEKHPDGRLMGDLEKVGQMYSLAVPYIEIKAVRPVLSSFAVQKCLEKLVSEAKTAVKPDSGLQATAKQGYSAKLEWQAVGLSTIESVQQTLQKHMPVAFHLLQVMTGDLKTSKTSDTRHPGILVCISNTSFIYTRLLPLSLGLLAFAYSAPVDLMAYCSRIGVMPAYTTISTSLERLAKDQAVTIAEHGCDPSKVGFLVFDNVQNYLRAQDQRIGSTNKMTIGLAATYCELNNVNPKALDLTDKQSRILDNHRAKLTTDQLLLFIDMKHLNKVFTLHWLCTLVNYIPQLSRYKSQVTMLFTTHTKKLCIPEGATPVHPLSSSGKSETVTTELKEAMHDFLSQIGQKAGDHQNRLLMVGGDGLSFQRLLEIKRYLQFHTENLESLAIIEPVLAVWHTEWTDVSRIFEAHWDSRISSDPSSLGHSASLIGRPCPPNLKKVDYYPSIDLMYLVLETRMIDCWHLPKLEELENIACTLHGAYSTTCGIYNALQDTTLDTPWSLSVPLGTECVVNQPNQTSLLVEEVTSSEQAASNDRHSKGDRVLSNSITFIQDALFSHEISYAVAEGDAGRVYEIMKARSTHSKYCTYLLEVITRLELESSQELVDAILQTTLVNMTGLPGACTAADVMQEYFNRLLEAIVEKKGINYGDHLARNVISPNLAHFACIKLNLRSGTGLAPRSGKHTVPNENPETRILLEAYRKYELHKRWPGCVYKETNHDQFSLGIVKLQSGWLQKWISSTTGDSNLLSRSVSGAVSNSAADDADDDDGVEDAEEECTQTFGLSEVINGELIIETFPSETLLGLYDEYTDEY
ncbi:hypothetical protein BDQ17DRAFT_1437367 [Cyathus striatus]|nr:hypothetical protein BDQ17DRAFT_1437367 [Cyathus striatus]